MAGPIQDVIEEDAADLQFPKGIFTFTNRLAAFGGGFVLQHVALI